MSTHRYDPAKVNRELQAKAFAVLTDEWLSVSQVSELLGLSRANFFTLSGALRALERRREIEWKISNYKNDTTKLRDLYRRKQRTA
jgi:hypothetical protein